jgi:beta-glucosidase
MWPLFLPVGTVNWVRTLKVPVVAVMVHGGSMDIGAVLQHTHAVVDASYPGVHGAQAIAEVLFGDYNPGGKTPYTWYKQNYTNAV